MQHLSYGENDFELDADKLVHLLALLQFGRHATIDSFLVDMIKHDERVQHERTNLPQEFFFTNVLFQSGVKFLFENLWQNSNIISVQQKFHIVDREIQRMQEVTLLLSIELGSVATMQGVG